FEQAPDDFEFASFECFNASGFVVAVSHVDASLFEQVTGTFLHRHAGVVGRRGTLRGLWALSTHSRHFVAEPVAILLIDVFRETRVGAGTQANNELAGR